MPGNIKGCNFRIHLINYIMPYFLAALYLDNKRHSLSLNQKVNLAPLAPIAYPTGIGGCRQHISGTNATTLGSTKSVFDI